jgi:hypothetical protein
LVVAIIAAAATAVALSFAVPHPRTKPDYRVMDLARAHHYGPARVQKAFADQGLRLRYRSNDLPGETWLSSTPLPVTTSGLYVIVVAAPNGTVSWGPKIGPDYDQPVANLDVHYGGTDARVLRAVKAAVAELQ